MVNWFRENCSVYEIYPQSETPHLTQIAHLDLDLDPTDSEDTYQLLIPGTVFWFIYYEVMILFWVWDYRLNHSIRFSLDVDLRKFKGIVEVNFILSVGLKLASNIGW